MSLETLLYFLNQDLTGKLEVIILISFINLNQTDITATMSFPFSLSLSLNYIILRVVAMFCLSLLIVQIVVGTETSFFFNANDIITLDGKLQKLKS